ncbi:putative phospholipid-transporting ATPase IIB [Echinococcus granulosus]|uniref:Phospholipid-transporting ATPase n=1 Tax=Echinococcus granulosus TaxID=6210 RepID=A0A068WNK0_ECHGR|nr:putative phospholipid-transporting ATPase IIB [Echinococcus granulosus]CDS21325.1 phospholipid transporting ATPase IIB [Echinococcus granulosus]
MKPATSRDSLLANSNRRGECGSSSPCCGSIRNSFKSLFSKCRRRKEYHSRMVCTGLPNRVRKFPPNVIKNQKYNIFTFIPLVLFEQFSVFLNLIFLIMACSQFIEPLRVGYLYTYWAPLGFVVAVTMIREAVDDIRRWLRDREVNNALYTKVIRKGQVTLPSAKIQVGDIILLHKNQRVPADMVLLWTSEPNGSCFIRTDQLDGETDWKLRTAIPVTQNIVHEAGRPEALFDIQAQIYAEAPNQRIHSFEGTFARIGVVDTDDGMDNARNEASLSVDQTLWSNTVVATGTAAGIVIYCGSETRAVMNSSKAHTKMGHIDREINNITKLLFVFVVILAFVMVALKGFKGAWYIYYWRFFLLFSYIIPLALRVNMDMAKIVYSFMITRDKDLPGCVVRSTTIPEELGRITYLLSDKTGTLTQNEMVFKKLHLGSVAFAPDSMDDLTETLRRYYDTVAKEGDATDAKQLRKTGDQRLVEAVLAIAICHNVTPMNDDSGLETTSAGAAEGLDYNAFVQPVGYQASSPDEVALVTWTASVGITLIHRDQQMMALRLPNGATVAYDILQIFPFTSEAKRMGIVVRERVSRSIHFYLKGADTIMAGLVQYTPWMEDEAGNLAREGLRTLVVAHRQLTEDQYADFALRYHQATMSVSDRTGKVQAAVATLECDLQLLCLTGVEDKLQEGVRPTLETLRNAGIKVWMLTGDKLETAECIAKSSRLVPHGQALHIFQPVTGRSEAHLELNAFRRRCDMPLVITGSSLEVCLRYYEYEFLDLIRQCPAVVVCRTSPTQKAGIAKLLKAHTNAVVAAIGDGGNDVSMIQAAHVGIGIVGKEGRQASLASDFSVTQFSHVARLFLVHGRNTYKNTASLSQFIIHRGCIITVMQIIFSAIFYIISVALFPGFLMVGYATIFTMFPVFSLVLDKDVLDSVAMTYPELYKDLAKGRELTVKTFFVWLVISIYQGGVIMYGALLLFDSDFIHVVSITFTSVLLTELLMVALTIHTWHFIMILAELASLAIYVVALVVFKSYFDQAFLLTWNFAWKVFAITAVSCIPLVILKCIRMKLRPPIYSKLR